MAMCQLLIANCPLLIAKNMIRNIFIFCLILYCSAQMVGGQEIAGDSAS